MPETKTQDPEALRRLAENPDGHTRRNGGQDRPAEPETGLPCSDILCDYSPSKGCRHCRIAPEHCAKPCCDG